MLTSRLTGLPATDRWLKPLPNLVDRLLNLLLQAVRCYRKSRGYLQLSPRRNPPRRKAHQRQLSTRRKAQKCKLRTRRKLNQLCPPRQRDQLCPRRQMHQLCPPRQAHQVCPPRQPHQVCPRRQLHKLCPRRQVQLSPRLQVQLSTRRKPPRRKAQKRQLHLLLQAMRCKMK